MLNILELAPDTRIELADGRSLRVVENMNDGMWVDAADDSGETELIHAQDILRVAEGGAPPC